MSARPWLDEPLIRRAALTLGTVAVFAPLLHPDGGGPDLTPSQRLGCLVLILFPALFAGALEPRGEGLASVLVQRLSRASPIILAMGLGGAILFPSAWTWKYVVGLFVLHLPLPVLWHVPRVRGVSLGLLTLTGFTTTVISPLGAWTLVAVGALWLVLPGLDRVEALRARAAPAARPARAPVLVAAGLLLLLGSCVFAGATALLPPTRPLQPFLPQRAQREPRLAQAAARFRPPLLELGLLVCGAAALLFLFQLAGGGRKKEGELPPAPGGMDVSAPRPLDPEALARAVEAWPPGPRREVVEAWLEQERWLAVHGHGRPPGRTPLRFAEDLAAARPELADAAARLSERFSAARWGPSPVGPEAAAEVRAAAALVTERLSARPKRGTISP